MGLNQGFYLKPLPGLCSWTCSIKALHGTFLAKCSVDWYGHTHSRGWGYILEQVPHPQLLGLPWRDPKIQMFHPHFCSCFCNVPYLPPSLPSSLVPAAKLAVLPHSWEKGTSLPRETWSNEALECEQLPSQLQIGFNFWTRSFNKQIIQRRA